MFRNNLKIAWRNLFKNKVFSFINILGLSLGITCSLLICLWVLDEYKFDRFHEKLDRIYSVTSAEYMDGEVRGSYDTPGLLGEEMPKVIPEVELACTVGWCPYSTFAVGEKKMKLPGVYAGNDFFKMFSYQLLEGNDADALNTIESIAISEKMANSLYGSSKKAIGQALKFENYKDLTVSAVFMDVPKNSSEQFDFVLSHKFFMEREGWLKDWHNSGPRTFLLLKTPADADKVSTKIKTIIANYDKEYVENDRLELGLQPYKEKYLYSNFSNGKIAGGRIEYVNLFTLVAIFILLIACINFMNLSTASSLKRAKEIGVRKVIGALKITLIKQFISEVMIFAILAVIFSVVLSLLILPIFNQLVSKQLSLPFQQPMFWLSILGLAIMTGLFSGSYPAFFLSSFRPIEALKSGTRLGLSAGLMRKGLVVFQFVLCIVFIVSTMIISNQVDYIHTKNIGYNKNNLIYLPISGELGTNFQSFKTEALKIPGIEGISQMSQRPLEIENSTGGVDWSEKPPGTSPRFTQAAIGNDFVKTMKAEILLGRDFSENRSDSANYLINETAWKRIGYADPIGKSLTFWGVKGTIIGVVKDFHFNSLHKPIEPLIMRKIGQPNWGYALIRANPKQISSVLTQLEALHSSFNPAFIFAHQFADEEFNYLYESENVVMRLSRYFSFIAIFISCLGLLGLAIFMTEQRTKEIGIRKVLGATTAGVVGLLSQDFLKLIIIALVIATPLAWYFMDKWLQDYAYHIDIQWTVFAIAGVVAVGVAFLTVSFQSIKAALANPVKSLRSE